MSEPKPELKPLLSKAEIEHKLAVAMAASEHGGADSGVVDLSIYVRLCHMALASIDPLLKAAEDVMTAARVCTAHDYLCEANSNPQRPCMCGVQGLREKLAAYKKLKGEAQ